MEWFQRWFGPLYEELYGHRDATEARIQVASLLRRTGAIEFPVLDAGCGAGRHLEALRAHGCRAFGIDLSAHLLSRAIERGPVVRGDLRSLPFRPSSFGLIAAFFSVFGYLETPEADLVMLSGLVDLLSPEGYLYLDLPDPDHVRAHLVAHDEQVLGDVAVVQERWIESGCVHKRITVRKGEGEPEQYLERVRLWERERVNREAGRMGLSRVALLGGPDGIDWTPGAARLGWLWKRC